MDLASYRQAIRQREAARRQHTESQRRALAHLAWFAVGLSLAFLTPYTFSSLLDLQHDTYYLVYFSVTLGFLSVYVRATSSDLAGLFRRNWRLSLVLGLITTAFVVANVLSRASTPGASGVYLAFEVFWRGLTYGIVDALLLTAFPSLVALNLLSGNVRDYRRKAAYAAMTLVLAVSVTAVYHLGYEQFREDGLAEPAVGNAIMSLPALATANPLGSIVAHASMHIAATAHSYETDIFLPPQTSAP